MPSAGMKPISKAKESKAALDLLFQQVEDFRDGERYLEIMRFIRRFPDYAPFNAFLLHTQKPGSQYVASVDKWADLGRRIKPGARPLVILWPFSPVRFVYEIGETEGDEPIPDLVLNPFKTRGRLPEGAFKTLLDNLACYGISLHNADHGSGSAGSIAPAVGGESIGVGRRWVKVGFDLIINRNHPEETQFATIAHELGHLFCGHLGNAGHGLWPSRTHLSHEVREFEAESVAWLVCARQGIQNPSERYLVGYLDDKGKTPEISFDTVLKAAGLIEEMTKSALRPPKDILV